MILSRQRDEVIRIGEDIHVHVVDIRGDKVRIGITAPKEIQVHRQEVFTAIQRENRAAAAPVDEPGAARPAVLAAASMPIDRVRPPIRLATGTAGGGGGDEA